MFILGSTSPIAVASGDNSRYEIKAGADFLENAYRFLTNQKDSDARILSASFDASTLSALHSYLILLDEFSQEVARNGTKFMFIYFPAYSQIYLPDQPMQIQATLKAACGRLGVPFLDLTPTFTERKDEILHLAPLDYHLNPRGNNIMAKAIFDFGIQQGFWN